MGARFVVRQHDERWAREPYAGSRSWTIGTHGCALTTLAMALSRAGTPIRPDHLNAHMRSLGLFAGGGRVRWRETVRACMGSRGRFVTVQDGRSAAAWLARGMSIVAGVNLDGGAPTHFVLLTGLVDDTQLTLADPRFDTWTLDDYEGEFIPRGFIAVGRNVYKRNSFSRNGTTMGREQSLD
jgi:hypothetical protein